MWVLVVDEVFATYSYYWIVVRMPSHGMAGVEQYIRSVLSSLFYQKQHQYGKERTNLRSWTHIDTLATTDYCILIMGK